MSVYKPKLKDKSRFEIPNGETKGPKLDIKIGAPNIHSAKFKIIGTSPLVVHRFSKKAKKVMLDQMMNPTKPGTKRKREPLNPEEEYNNARYVSPEGWDGFNVSGVRNAMVSACRLVRMKMTIAKLAIFVEADGRDKDEPQYGLIRIDGTRKRLDMIARLPTGQCCPTFRPMYFPWKATIKIHFDADQLSVEDIANLLNRVGCQTGLGEGRNDSRESCGMGWGSFTIESKETE